MQTFELNAPYKESLDQKQAIEKILGNIQKNIQKQTVLGVTGSGKTFVMANIIEKLSRPTLILSHNKTLAAQLYEEFKEIFPKNSVKTVTRFEG